MVGRVVFWSKSCWEDDVWKAKARAEVRVASKGVSGRRISPQLERRRKELEEHRFTTLHPRNPWVVSVSVAESERHVIMWEYERCALVNLFSFGSGGEDGVVGEVLGVQFHDADSVGSECAFALLLVTCERGVVLCDYMSRVVKKFVVGTLKGACLSTNAVTISSELVAFGCSDGIVRVWSVKKKCVVLELPKRNASQITHLTVLKCIESAEDFAFFVSSSNQGDLFMWKLRIQKLPKSQDSFHVKFLNEAAVAELEGSGKPIPMTMNGPLHPSGVAELRYYNDLKKLISSGVDGSTTVWSFSLDGGSPALKIENQWRSCWELSETLPCYIPAPLTSAYPSGSLLAMKDNGELVLLNSKTVVLHYANELVANGTFKSVVNLDVEENKVDTLIPVEVLLRLFDPNSLQNRSRTPTTPDQVNEAPQSPDPHNVEAFQKLSFDQTNSVLIDNDASKELVFQLVLHPTNPSLVSISTRHGTWVVSLVNNCDQRSEALMKIVPNGHFALTVHDQRLTFHKLSPLNEDTTCVEKVSSHDLGFLDPWQGTAQAQFNPLTHWPGQAFIDIKSCTPFGDESSHLHLIALVWPKINRYAVFQIDAYELGGKTIIRRTRIDCSFGSSISWAWKPSVQDLQQSMEDDQLFRVQLFVATPAVLATVHSGKKKPPSASRSKSFRARRVASFISTTGLKRSSAASTWGTSSSEKNEADDLDEARAVAPERPSLLLLKEYAFGLSGESGNTRESPKSSSTSNSLVEEHRFVCLGRSPDRVAVSPCEIIGLIGRGPFLTVIFGQTTSQREEIEARSEDTSSTPGLSSPTPALMEEFLKASDMGGDCEEETNIIDGQTQMEKSSPRHHLQVVRVGETLQYRHWSAVPAGAGCEEMQNQASFFAWDIIATGSTFANQELEGDVMELFRLRSVGDPFGHPSCMVWDTAQVPSKCSLPCAIAFNQTFSSQILIMSLSTLGSNTVGRATLVRQTTLMYEGTILDLKWFRGSLFILDSTPALSCTFWSVKGTMKPFPAPTFDVESAESLKAHIGEQANLKLRSRRLSLGKGVTNNVKYVMPFQLSERIGIREVEPSYITSLSDGVSSIVYIRRGRLVLSGRIGDPYLVTNFSNDPIIKIGTLAAAGYAKKAASWGFSLPKDFHDKVSQILSQLGYLNFAVDRRFLPGLSVSQQLRVCLENVFFEGSCAIVKDVMPDQLDDRPKAYQALQNVGLLSGCDWYERAVSLYLLERHKMNIVKQLATLLGAFISKDEKNSQQGESALVDLCHKCIVCQRFGDARYCASKILDGKRKSSMIDIAVGEEMRFFEHLIPKQHERLKEMLMAAISEDISA